MTKVKLTTKDLLGQIDTLQYHDVLISLMCKIICSGFPNNVWHKLNNNILLVISLLILSISSPCQSREIQDFWAPPNLQ